MMNVTKSEMKKDSSQLRIAANLKIKEKNYWLKRLSGGLVRAGFPLDEYFLPGENGQPGNRETANTGEGANKERTVFMIPSDIAGELIHLSGGSDSRLHMVLITVLSILIYKYTGEKDFVLGTPIFIDPKHSDVEYINTVLPIKLQVKPGMTGKELLMQVRQVMVEAIENYAYPVELLPEQLGLEISERHFPLFDVALLLENIQERNHLRQIENGLGMVFNLNKFSHGIEGYIAYCPERFHQDTVGRIAANFLALSSALPGRMETLLSEIDILSPAEKQEILYRLSVAGRREDEWSIEKQVTVSSLFSQAVIKFTNRTALAGNYPCIYISYGELAEYAMQIAYALQSRGVKPGMIIGLMVDRSLDILINILGIWNAGCAYLPIDPSYPDERIGYMLSDSCVPVIVTDETQGSRVKEIIRKSKGIKPGSLIVLDTLAGNQGEKEGTIPNGCASFVDYSSTSLAYIIYTSGTTGKPKGVMVNHGNLVTYLSAFLQEFPIDENDIIVQQASYAFDAFIEEAFPVLTRGGLVVIPLRDVVKDIMRLGSFLKRHAVSVMSCSPLMLDQLSVHPGDISGIRLFISGGDVLKKEYTRGLPALAKIYNTYGPTESTVCATYYNYHQDENRYGGGIPIGQPILGYEVYILNENLRLLPIGATGELCIGGVGVSRGYLNHPELTADKFIANPFKPGEILYRSGDLASWQRDGNLRFYGRLDRQIQLRGFRIEPGEIEYLLLKYGGIEDAVVVGRTGKNGEMYLCAYIITNRGIGLDDLREFLSRGLPGYMVPSFFIPLTQLPRTVQGKLDIKALPEPVSGQAMIPYFSSQQLEELAAQNTITPAINPGPVKMDEERRNNGIRCFIMGETHLLIHCAEILLRYGSQILGIISNDPNVILWAKEKSIGCIPLKRTLIVDFLQSSTFDFLFSIYNTLMLDDEILKLPGRYVINFHDGPLPGYAGLYVPSWAIINGETEYGVTWHIAGIGADTGDIFIQEAVDIKRDDTAFSLNVRCIETGARAFEKLIQDLIAGKETRKKQNLQERSYYGKYDRPVNGALISFAQEAIVIDRLVRGLDFSGYKNPLGVPRLAVKNTLLVISAVSILDTISKQLPGTIMALREEGMTIATTTNDILLEKILTVSGKPITIPDLVKTFQLYEGYQLTGWPEETVRHLDESIVRCSRHESYWVNHLLETRPLRFFNKNALVSSGGNKVERERIEFSLPGFVSAEIPGNFLDKAVAVFAIMLGQVSGLSSFSVGYSDKQQMNEFQGVGELIAEVVPFHINLESCNEMKNTVELLVNELKQIRKHRTYLRDVFIREPGLQFFPEIQFPVLVLRVNRFDDISLSYFLPGKSQFQFLIEESSGQCLWCWDAALMEKTVNMAWQEYFLRLFQKVVGDSLAQLHVFSDEPTIPGEWLAIQERWVRLQGNIEIDLAQVEFHLSGHADIQNVVTIARRDEVWVLLVSQRRFFETELRDYLMKRMWVPPAGLRFIRLEAIPTTMDGQTDIRVLERLILETALSRDLILPVDETEKQLVHIWSEILGIEKKAISTSANFFEMGGNSLSVVRLSQRLQEEFQVDIPVITLFRHTSIHAQAGYMNRLRQRDQVTAVRVETQGESILEGFRRDVAVIGMACKFPGADHLDEFWENLVNGVESIRFFTDEELKADGIDSHVLQDPSFIKSFGYLQDKEYFDAAFFGYTPLEAELMDPQLRMLYQTTWEALESAGYNAESYDRRIGFYAGSSPSFYWETLTLLSGKSDRLGHFGAALLLDRDYITTRVSYKLNLKGPSFSVQTACSTSLVAIHMAYRGLLGHECELALAGGVSIFHDRDKGYFYRDGMILSKDGRCRTFDARASGTVSGNGVGIVVLKLLDQAIADGDYIYAVIKGTAINNDGNRKMGYTAPSVQGQVDVVRAAYRFAGISPESITYVEAHGTGTMLGDPVEVEALTEAFATNKREYCRIGSVKTNIGHLDSAAGVAGFIKTVLSLKHRQIPASLNYETPNPNIDFKNSPFYVNTRLSSWESDGSPIRAGVSSFGIGGTNAHVVLEEAPVIERDRENPGNRRYHLVVLSAKTATALEKTTENLVHFLKKQSSINLADITYTLQVGRQSFQHRKMMVCETIQELTAELTPGHSNRLQVAHPLSRDLQNGIIFMFPGQGSQYSHMAFDLYQDEPIFQKEMDLCFQLLTPLLGRDARALLFPGEHEVVDIKRTDFAQPLIFIVEYCLARLLMSMGIKPRAMIGHSIGEYTAACLAGVFTLEETLNIVAARGRFMQSLPSGSMLSIPLPEEKVLSCIREFHLQEQVSLAAMNTVSSCVISGPTESIELIGNHLKSTGVEARPLHTSHAFHSPMMEPILAKFERVVSQASFGTPTIPFISNVTGTWITGENARSPRYWTDHLRMPVRFQEGLTELLKGENGIFLEVGSGKALCGFIRQQVTGNDNLLITNLLRHPRETVTDDSLFLDRIGRIWLRGVHIDWNAYYRDEKRYRVPLPTYPFEGRFFWIRQEAIKMAPGPVAFPGQSTNEKKAIADWFYLPVWKQSFLRVKEQRKSLTSQQWLIFTDNYGVGNYLVQCLEQENQTIISVQAGVRFCEDSFHRYTIDPGKEKDFEILFQEMQRQKLAPGYIVFLWGINPIAQWEENGLASNMVEHVEHMLEQGYYALNSLVRSAVGVGFNHQMKLVVVTSRLHSITGEEEVLPASALLLGPVRAITREYPQIKCCTIDFNYSIRRPSAQEQIVEQIIDEVTGDSGEMMIAYRGNGRWVQVFQSISLDDSDDMPRRLKHQGVYLITGGQGGIGYEIATYLAQQCQARLVLTGRTSLPARNDWREWLLSHGENDPVSYKIKQVEALESLGAELLTCSADCADFDAMQQVVSLTLKKYGTINGVIHCAGIADGGMVQRRTRLLDEKVLSAKVFGTLVLDRLTAAIPLDFFILCSSLSSTLNVFGQVAYIGANAFLDAFACWKSTNSKTTTLAIDWGLWLEVGMGVETKKKPMGNTVFFSRDKNEDESLIQEIKHHLFYGKVKHGDDRCDYLGTFSIEKYWFLSEHMFSNNGILPGTAYLEMVYAAFLELTGKNRIEIRDTYFIQPLIVAPGEEKEVRVVLKDQGDFYSFIVMSGLLHGEPGEWEEHTRGKVLMNSSPVEKKYNLEELRAHFHEKEDGSDLVRERNNREGTLQYGPRWKNGQWIKFDQESGLAFLQLPDKFREDTRLFHLHPALMDIATSFLSTRYEDERVYLPFSYQRLRVERSLPAKIAVYARLQEKGETGKRTMAFDIAIMDEGGDLLVEIEGFTRLQIALDRLEKPAHAQVLTGKDGDGGAIPVQSSGIGILSHEGVNAFKRLLAVSVPRVLVSPRELTELIEEYQREATPLSQESHTGAMPIEEPGFKNQRPDLSTVYTLPETIMEKKLAKLWERFFGIEPVGIHDDFFELGGDSVGVAALSAYMFKEIDVEIPIVEFFNRPTIFRLAEYISQKKLDKDSQVQPVVFHSIPVVEKKEYYPLSTPQRRLFFSVIIDSPNTKFNIPNVLKLEGQVDIERIQGALTEIIQVQDSLRTSFDLIDDIPVQIIHDKVDFHVVHRVVEEFHLYEYADGFVRPFDIKTAPLLRAELIEISSQEYVFLLDVHHIIADAMSVDLLIQGFMTLYGGGSLLPLKVQYVDFAQWYQEQVDSGIFKSQRAYWLNLFNDSLPVLELPTDFPRPTIQSFAGDDFTIYIEKLLTGKINAFCQKNEVTLFMFLLSVYYIILSKYSGQEDIVISTTIMGRSHADLENLLGMFVNLLPIRNFPGGNISYEEFLKQVKTSALKSYENQDYQFDALLEELGVERNLSRSPLQDVQFSSLNFDYFAAPVLPGSTEVEPGDDDIGIKQLTGLTRKASLADITLFYSGRETLIMTFEYCRDLFLKSTIENFARRFKGIIESVLEQPLIRLRDIDILTENEKQQIIITFNQTEQPYPNNKTLHCLFEEQVERTPDSIVLVGDLGGANERDREELIKDFWIGTVSYRELNRRADHICFYLREKGMGEETIIGLMMGRNLDMIISVIGILKAGGVYLPIATDFPATRINYLLADGNVKLVLTDKNRNQGTSINSTADFVEVSALEKMTKKASLPGYEQPTISERSLAYVIYTSGSTGMPKGVMVEHRSVARLVMNNRFFEWQPNDRLLQTGALEFDVSTFEIWGTLLNGAMFFLSPVEKILDTFALKHQVRRYNITTMWLTSSLFSQLSRADIDIFEGLKYLLVGGDVVSPIDINRLKLAFPGLNIISGYGPTENTTFSTSYYIEKSYYHTNIPIGKPLDNSTAYILDKYENLLPIGIVGEVAVGGDGLARGYLNDPERTAEGFLNKNKLGVNHSVPDEIIYKTGDLGRWLPDGNIEFFGRIDNQVKIRGFRIEISEIERHLLLHPSIKEALVRVREYQSGEKYLCAYVVWNNGSSEDKETMGTDGISSLREFLSYWLPEYMLPTFFVSMEQLPLTANGKINVKALPTPTMSGSSKQGYVAPRDKVELELSTLWKEVLYGDDKGRRTGESLHLFPGQAMDIDENFFQAGGHSLKVTALLSRIYKLQNIQVPINEFFKTPTIRGLANFINEEKSSERYMVIEPVEQKEFYPLSAGQERLYILMQMGTVATAYNIPSLIPLPEMPDIKQLHVTFQLLINRHESLRTSFHVINDQPIQKIHENVEFFLEKHCLENGEDVISRFIRPFDLQTAPLLRAVVIEFPGQHYILLVDVHHIISDGISQNILVEDFLALYEKQELPKLKLQYKDYCEWQNHEKQEEKMKKQEEYWLKQFTGKLPSLHLPLDFMRSGFRQFEGHTIIFELDVYQTRQLNNLVLRTGTTMYMLLLAILNLLLAKLSGQEDIIVGLTSAGRRHPDLEKIMGMFVNTLAIRNFPSVDKTFDRFLNEVKENTLDALENQDYQFDDLLEKLDFIREPGRNPLFDVMFTLQNQMENPVYLPGEGDLGDRSWNYSGWRIAKFDINLNAYDKGEQLKFTMEYSTHLFKTETIKLLIEDFIEIITRVLVNPSGKISSLLVISDRDKECVLVGFNKELESE